VDREGVDDRRAVVGSTRTDRAGDYRSLRFEKRCSCADVTAGRNYVIEPLREIRRITTLRFHDVILFRMHGFNHQNAIFGLSIESWTPVRLIT